MIEADDDRLVLSKAEFQLIKELGLSKLVITGKSCVAMETPVIFEGFPGEGSLGSLGRHTQSDQSKRVVPELLLG